MTPTEQPAAPKRPRVETVSSALDIFARKITSPEMVEHIRLIIAAEATAKIDITVLRCADGSISARLDVAAKQQHTTTAFRALTLP